MKSRLVDRIYVAFVILIGSWSLWRYYTFCFSDCIYAVTARSLVITTTTTQFTLDELANLTAHGGATSELPDTVVKRRVDARPPHEVRDELTRKKAAKSREKLDKKVDKEQSKQLLAEIRAMRAAFHPAAADDDDKDSKKIINNANIPSDAEKSAVQYEDDAYLAEQIPSPSRSARGGRRTSKKTIVKRLSLKDRFTPIVIRDLVWLLISIVCTVMLVWSYFRAITTDPGAVPKCFSVYAQKASRMALSTGGTLAKCTMCQVFKPPRCHHCSKCGRCVLKYDHHCYWIGQCVGYFNYKVFLNFCFWTWVFSNVAAFSLSRSVYLFFFEVVSSATPAQTVLHAITETTTVYIRESPVFGSTEVTHIPITADIILLFIVVVAAGSLSWYMLKKHYFLARDNKTTVEEMVLDGDPSPYGLSQEHNWEEVFGDKSSPIKGPLRWIWRIIPILAYGRQKQEEIDSEEYFKILKEEKRRQRKMRDYKQASGYGATEKRGATATGAEATTCGEDRKSKSSRPGSPSRNHEEDDNSEATLSQPSSSDTNDEEKQNQKVEKRRKNTERLQKRIDRRDKACPHSPEGPSHSHPNDSNLGMATSYSMGSSAAEGMTPYNPPHTPPDRELVVGERHGLLGDYYGNHSSVYDERLTIEGRSGGAIVELCPQGTHFAKNVTDSTSGEDEEIEMTANGTRTVRT